MNYQVNSPVSKQDWQAYYQFRWQILREPWQQPAGSEKDEHEAQAVHRMITDNKHNVIAVGRIHLTDKNTAQIRYMAVSPQHERQGLGSVILKSLEQAAISQHARIINLHARENAVAFYNKHGYKVIKPSHVLYDRIQHYLMTKEL